MIKFTYVSHASFKLEGEFGTLLTDPWILNEPVYAFTTWKFPAATMSPQKVVQNVKYVYLSHPHEDHLHIPSFHLIPRSVEILLPEYTVRPGLRSQTVERTLREMGFNKIRKLLPWQPFLLGGKTPFTIIPACEMKWWDWENSGFVLQYPGCTILNMNDSPSDPALYAEVSKRFGTIDLGLVQYSGVSMFPGCYRMPKEQMGAASKQRKESWIQQKNMIELLDVKRIAPIAGDFAWLDERMFHCNQHNRNTPEFFKDFVKNGYPEKNIEVLVLNPEDTWSPSTGIERVHPPIDWNNYIDAISELKQKLQPKVDAINQWIESSDRTDLLQRSREHLASIQTWITQDYVNFSARVRVQVEGPNSGFSFVMKSNPDWGFLLDWEDTQEVDQTLFVREATWAAVLEGKILLTNIQWAGEMVEHVPFRLEIAHFWFWFETYIDLNNRNPQALIDRALHPEIEPRIRPNLGVFPLPGEWSDVSENSSEKTQRGPDATPTALDRSTT